MERNEISKWHHVLFHPSAYASSIIVSIHRRPFYCVVKNRFFCIKHTIANLQFCEERFLTYRSYSLLKFFAIFFVLRKRVIEALFFVSILFIPYIIIRLQMLRNLYPILSLSIISILFRLITQ